MDTTQIEEFFYSRASSRIRKKIEESGLKYAEIYKPDHKQISRIVNNKRNKNNKFLICDAVICNSYKDEETGIYIKCGLLATKELGFKSVKEILWGTDEEISAYLYDLFIILWHTISEFSSYYNIDTESYLCDYVPYAEYSTYYNILFNSSNKYPAIFYGIKEDTVIEKLEPSRDAALKYLYEKCKAMFSKALQDFTDKNLTFHKLDKTINDKLLKIFVKILEAHKPNTESLGLRVRALINADLHHCASMIVERIYDDYYYSLISASSQYIHELERIQNQTIQEKIKPIFNSTHLYS